MTTDLSTRYLGLDLANPLVASASPLTGSIDGLLELEQAGAGAVVLPSLFEEQVEHEAISIAEDYFIDIDANPEAAFGYFPALDDYNTGAEEYVELVAMARQELSIPVIGSLNGASDGGWTRYASIIESAGAHAIELNVYHVAADPDVTAAQVEDRYLRLVEQVRAAIEIPLAVKIGPYFSSVGNMARRLASAGADGLVLFNRFYQPDIDLDTLRVTPDLVLSTPAEMRLVLRWIAILRAAIDADLAATTGVHDGAGATKLLLAGADVVMMASALLAGGPAKLTEILDEVGQWFGERGYRSLTQARGSVSQAAVPDPSAFERVNYMKTLTSYRRPVPPGG